MPNPPRCTDSHLFFTGFDVYCTLPAGHDGDHQGDGFTWNDESTWTVHAVVRR